MSYSNGMSENAGEFSVDVLKREVSEGSCHDGNVGSGLGCGFVSLRDEEEAVELLLPVLT